MTNRKWLLSLLLLTSLACPVGQLSAVELDSAVVPLLKRSFFEGREYFVLRSGRAKMVVQADKADLGPAFTYLLFDAENSKQTKLKERALNFADGQGLVNSALEVVLGGHAFTALGHQTETRWTTVDGIPAVEAVWWAGGLRVTERIFALVGENAFVRRVQLESVNLAGAENVTLRFSLPPGQHLSKDGIVAWVTTVASAEPASAKEATEKQPEKFVSKWNPMLVLTTRGAQPHRANEKDGVLEVGPLALSPGQSASVDTILHVRDGAKRDVIALPDDLAQDDQHVDGAIAKTRNRWTGASSVTTSDVLLRDIFDHARFGLAGMVADNGTMDAGMFEYGDQWVRDTSNTLLGMVHAGQFELARAGFEHVLKDLVRDDGAPMTAGAFDDPDQEEFDQMGELIHALKAYRDWSGDDSLIRQYRTKLRAMVERPLNPTFRDSSAMLHNRREYWERTLDDGYELVYQTYLVRGLRDAADLAVPLDASDRAAPWRAEADRTLTAMLSHPTLALVENGRLIKRRGPDGRRIKEVPGWGKPDVPGQSEKIHLSDPDTGTALPIALGIVDPRSPLARKTLDELESLWNARWFGGGYDRYHSSGQGDQPGPWPFASCFVMRAQHDAGRLDGSRRTLEWLATVQGGRTGAWFEEIPLIRSTTPGVLPWISGEVSLFVVRHVLGVRFEGDRMVLKPALYPNSPPVKADLRFRKARLRLEVGGSGPVQFAELDGHRIEPDRDGAIRVPADFAGGVVVIRTAASK
ncbi:MAG: hypothetical protein LLG00_16445 [Planctomycetaceae bacterium]|nr:hypothetical protein [Planctomycetaceae bacterium]